MKHLKFEQEHRGITKQVVLIILFALACLAFLLYYRAIFGVIGSFFSSLLPVFVGFFIALAIYPMQSSIERYLIILFSGIASRRKKSVLSNRKHGASPAGSRGTEPVINKTDGISVKKDTAKNIKSGIASAASRFFRKKTDAKRRKSGSGINKSARFISIIAALLIVLLIIVLFISVMIPQITESYENLKGKYLDFSSAISQFMSKLSADDENSLAGQALGVINSFISGITSSLTDMTPYLIGILKSSVSVTMDVFVGIVIAVYLLIDRERLLRICRRLLQSLLPKKVVDRIRDNSNYIFEVYNSYFTGKLIDILIIWGLSVALLSLFSVPFAPFISIILAIMNVIPYIGIFLGLLPGLLIVLIADPGKLLLYLLSVIVIHLIDSRLIEKYVLHTTCSIDSEVLIIAVVLFGGLFGTPSMFIAAPIATIIYHFSEDYINRLLARRGSDRTNAGRTGKGRAPEDNAAENN